MSLRENSSASGSRMCSICVCDGGDGDSLKFSVDLHPESRGLPPVRHIHPLAMPSDMPRSLCALNHAGTGKEESSAKEKETVVEEFQMRRRQNSARSGSMERRRKDWRLGH